MKIHFVNVRTMHHSAHSGYDRLMDYVSQAPLSTSRVWKKMSERERKRAYHQAKEQISWYNLSDLEMETNVNALDPRVGKHVCHFLYGENSVYHIKKSDNPRKKIFVSFHQPPEVHQQFIRTREPLQSIDGLIVVGTNQIPFFEQYMDRSNIHFIPHGVDTDFFKPGPTTAKITNKVLFVGNWLRDFETLVAVAEILAGLGIEPLMILEHEREHADEVRRGLAQNLPLGECFVDECDLFLLQVPDPTVHELRRLGRRARRQIALLYQRGTQPA